MNRNVGGVPRRLAPIFRRDRQPPHLSARIEKVGSRNCREGAQIAKAGERGVVPKNAVTLRRDQKGHHNIGVVLPQVQVIALDVHDPELHLAQAV